MAQHPSLRSKGKGRGHRSVLKRFERIELLKERNLWAEANSVFGLPKVKTLRIKIKKEKPKEAQAAVAPTTSEAAAASTQTQATGASPVKKKEEPKAQK